jgi:hypothetical protein
VVAVARSRLQFASISRCFDIGLFDLLVARRLGWAEVVFPEFDSGIAGGMIDSAFSVDELDSCVQGKLNSAFEIGIRCFHSDYSSVSRSCCFDSRSPPKPLPAMLL